MRAGSGRWQRFAALPAEVMLVQAPADVNDRPPLLAVTPAAGSCLSQVRLVVPSGAAEGVMTLTKSFKAWRGVGGRENGYEQNAHAKKVVNCWMLYEQVCV